MALLGLFLAITLVVKGKKRLITAKILEDRAAGTDFVYDLICSEFPKSCILKDAPVSCSEAGGVQITQAPDILYISRGGVMIISVVNGDGAFDNPKTGPWRFRYMGANNTPVTTSLANPFDTAIPAANILEGLLAGEKIYVDVHKIAVFSGCKVGMTTKYPEAMSVNDLITYLTEFDQRTVMNGPQFRLASEVITAFAQYNQHKALSTRRYTAPIVDTAKIEQPSDEVSVEPIAEETPTPVGEENYEVLNFEAILDQSANKDDNEAIELLREVQFELDKNPEPNDENEVE